MDLPRRLLRLLHKPGLAITIRHHVYSGRDNEFSFVRRKYSKLFSYPNPNNGHFVIEGVSDETLIITNELGQIVRTFELNAFNDHKINIDGLKDGMYFIAGEKCRYKVVVTH